MFLELHFKDNKEPVSVNIEKIDYITRRPLMHKSSAIIMIGEFPLVTMETYEEVVRLLGYEEE